MGDRRGLEQALGALDQRSLEHLARAAGPVLAAPPRRLPGARGRPHSTAAGIEFQELKAYAPGDERLVDWRASARAGAPQVRRFRDERAADWYLLLDCSSSMVTPSPGKWLRAVQAGLALGWLALAHGDRVALSLVGEGLTGHCPPGRGAAHFAALVETLRRNPAVPATGVGSHPAAAVGVVRAPAVVVVVGDMLRHDGMRPDLGRLAAAADHLRLIQIQHPAEAEVPAADAALDLEDAEDGRQRPADGGAGRALAHYNARLARWCARRGIALSRHLSTEPYSAIVLGHLHRPRRA